MQHFLRWLGGGDAVPGSPLDLGWAWVTLALSTLVAAGYVSIGVARYFHSRLGRDAESEAAFKRLCAIVLCSAVLGTVFFATDMFWLAWRLYDVVLFGLVVHTWSFARRMRGLAAVGDRLARVAELERSVDRYREIAERLPQIVWTARADGGVDFSNRRWADYCGDARTWLDAVHPDERGQVRAWWEQTVAARAPASREVRLGGPGSEYRAFVVHATPVGEGKSMKWLGACADIEEQKRSAAEAETRGKRKMFFLNALSHDLRAPLHNVALNAHLLKQMARGEMESESAKAIVDNAVAAGDLVNKLLDFARVDGLEANVAERVDVGGTLRQVVRRFVPVAEPKGLTLRVIAGDDVEVLTDRQKLERVVTNLVDNAIKFTEAGSVTVELRRRDGGACVRVADTGVGVPPDDAPRLFEEFFQVGGREADPGGGGRTKGFGMGLAICRSLARQLRGDVRLVRTGPEGTTFELTVSNLPTEGASPAGEDRPAVDVASSDVCFG